MNQYHLQTL
ncbi:hypothetical protein M8C21_021639 [Ambrosia artemisiifolia]|uniref:Uncharacterized protein n=1 Tax=Ambrosia artemisiifolia TaxID=4212 RepID=A0AAD5CVI2_AMBAR|nr:hypothetical protein M8C21_021639 [Ambrosia artemisiifolia]